MSNILEAIYAGKSHEAERLAEGRELTIFEAAALGRTARLLQLLDEDSSGANAFGDDGFHPVGLACFFGHVEAAKLLMERGADPNLPQGSGFRAIDAARQNGDSRVERLLVEHGATP